MTFIQRKEYQKKVLVLSSMVFYVIFIYFVGVVLIDFGYFEPRGFPVDMETQKGVAALGFFLFLACYSVATFLISGWLRRKKFTLLNFKERKAFVHTEIDNKLTLKVVFLIFLLLIIFSYYSLFVVDGLSAMYGEINRGEYRRKEYFGGPLRTLIVGFFPKIIYCLSALFVMNTKNKTIWIYLFFSFSTLLVALIAFSTGFRGAVIFYFAPAATVFMIYKFRRVGFRHLLFFTLLALSFVFMMMYFLGRTEEGGVVNLLERVFIVPVQVPYLLINKYFWVGDFYDYFPTLSYVFGGTLVGVFFLDGIENLVNYNFSWKITSLMGYSTWHQSVGGHSNTATIVGEAYYMGGLFGVLFLAFFLSFLVYLLSRFLLDSLSNGKLLTSSLILVFFWGPVISWVNGGGVTRIIDANSIVLYILCYILVRLFLKPFCPVRKLRA